MDEEECVTVEEEVCNTVQAEECTDTTRQECFTVQETQCTTTNQQVFSLVQPGNFNCINICRSVTLCRMKNAPQLRRSSAQI